LPSVTRLPDEQQAKSRDDDQEPRPVQDADMAQAWIEARKLHSELLEEALTKQRVGDGDDEEDDEESDDGGDGTNH